MKFWAPIVTGAALVAAADLTPAEVIGSQISNITNATQSLGTVVQKFEGLEQAADLLTASTRALSTIQYATTRVKDIGFVTIDGALSLTAPILALSAIVNSTIGIVISKKPVFVKAGIGGLTLTSLQQQQCASNQFNNASASKLPGGGISLASAEIGRPIQQALINGIEAYMDQAANDSQPIDCAFVNSTTPVNPDNYDQLVGNSAGLATQANSLAVVLVAALVGVLMV